MCFSMQASFRHPGIPRLSLDWESLNHSNKVSKSLSLLSLVGRSRGAAFKSVENSRVGCKFLTNRDAMLIIVTHR